MQAEGSTIDGKYLLARQLGRGGMGAVFEAQNQSTLKRCAIKLILDKHLDDERHRARFFREARASSVADSEHIVQIFDCGTDEENDIPYIVMELLDGESLDAAMERLGPIDPQIAARIALQAAAGLARAHAAGIVHRDIKPANLFLAKSDLGDIVVKVLDFGLAKAKQDAEASLTQSGTMVGTPSYMSPEQALGEKTVDGAADVWSLGVVLFEMLTGTLPFVGTTSIALMIKIAQDDVPLVQERAPWVPPPLAEIVHRCLSRDRSTRYLDATSLRDALASWVADSRLTSEMLAGAAADRSQQVTKIEIPDSQLKGKASAKSAQSAATASPRRHRAWVAGAIAVGIAAAIAIPLALGRGATPAPTPPLAPLEPVVREDPPPAPRPEPPAPTPLALALHVAPKGVRVEIDGAPATVENGAVTVRGFPGDGRVVTLRDAKRSLTQEVIVRSDGTLTPSRLELTDAGIKRAKADAKAVTQAKAIEQAKAAEREATATGSAAPATTAPGTTNSATASATGSAAPTPTPTTPTTPTTPAPTTMPPTTTPPPTTTTPPPTTTPPAPPTPTSPTVPGDGGTSAPSAPTTPKGKPDDQPNADKKADKKPKPKDTGNGVKLPGLPTIPL